jgi:hypothetical protein
MGFLSRYRVQTGLGDHPTSYHWVPGALTPRIKQQKRVAGHLPSSSVAVKNAWSLPPLFQYVFMVQCFVKHRDSLLLPSIILTM